MEREKEGEREVGREGARERKGEGGRGREVYVGDRGLMHGFFYKMVSQNKYKVKVIAAW